MQYGFLIDHDRCIGCHACTVACKSENSVPVGNFRTWVKYTEVGAFPSVKRSFAVLRCNHCTSAPCVTICPVGALEKRPDGIVDLDRDACFGCRACMQACPYDALHLNEERGAVEKCHFCAHRVEQGMAPACAVVCPTEAIVYGDLHDKESLIARRVSEEVTLLRRIEQKTGPNVHYVGVEPLALQPGEPVRLDTYLWSERRPTKPEPWPHDVATVEGARTVLDVGHKVEWGWGVAIYLVTKGLAAGAGMLAPFVPWLGLSAVGSNYAPELLSLVFTGLTTALLVADLTRPWAFLRLLTRPNTKSWLVKGAWLLIAASAVAALSLGLRLAGLAGASDALRWLLAPLSAGVAGYTAFLFAQCEGRDLWQDRGTLLHLLLQALALGAAGLLPFAGRESPLRSLLLVGALGFIVATMHLVRKAHPTANARQAVGFLKGLKVGGVPAVPLALVLVGVATVLPAGLSVATLMAGLLVYEFSFVRAGQLPPLS